LLDYFVQNGQAVAAVPLAKPLPDADDEAFLEVAFSGQADALVTGNLSHFPKRLCSKINVLSPADFLAFYQK
ncbi:MAG TPA: putative toxin-antitoxin system toxin component, PIN family, partial [Syntrophaceae bacterium]|nr:putative toxin-antitoxin system toxin component, PIN family [Syntrophaceae bacterium]